MYLQDSTELKSLTEGSLVELGFEHMTSLPVTQSHKH